VRNIRDREGAGARREHCRQHPDRRRLPGAVRAEEAEHDPPRDGEVNLVDGRERAVGLRQPVRLDGELHA
jgi:hypothetical protein